MFSKELNADEVVRSKRLHAMLSNVPFCKHYIDDMNYCSLIRLRFNGKALNVLLEFWDNFLFFSIKTYVIGTH